MNSLSKALLLLQSERKEIFIEDIQSLDEKSQFELMRNFEKVQTPGKLNSLSKALLLLQSERKEIFIEDIQSLDENIQFELMRNFEKVQTPEEN